MDGRENKFRKQPLDLNSQRAKASPRPTSSFDGLPLFTFNDLLWFLYLYPLRLLSAFDRRNLIYWVGTLAQPFVQFRARERRKIVVSRMLAAPHAGITPGQALKISRQFIANSTFRMLDDLVLSSPSFLRLLRCEGVQGIEHLERGMSAGKGVIILTAHFCASRIAKRYLATIGYPMLSVRDRRPPGDWWGRLGRRILEPRHVELLQAVIGESVYVEDPGCTLKILRRLRSGGLVNIHFDGRSGTRTTLWPFLGAPRRFSTGIFDLIRLSGCAVVPMLGLGRSAAFRIIFGPMLDIVNAPERGEFVRANLSAFVETIEQQIKDNPGEWEQWMSF